MKQKRWRIGCLVLSLLTVPGIAGGMSVPVMANSAIEKQGAETQKKEVQEPEKQGTKTQKTEVQESEAQGMETQGTELESESEVQAGERTATIMVVSITGNELTYYEIEDETEKESEAESDSEVENGLETMSATKLQEDGTEVEGESEQERMSQSGDQMTPPDGISQGNGQMTPPDGMPQGDSQMTPPDGMSQGNEQMKQPGNLGKQSKSGNLDTKTVYLPVPVAVHTDADETRTFSILEAGDRLQVTIVTDEEGKETITEIWMLSE